MPDPLPSAVIYEIAAVMAESDGGLTHKLIGRLLAEFGLRDALAEAEAVAPPGMTPTINKRDRLGGALVRSQHETGSSATVLRVVEQVMSPVTFSSRPEQFEAMRGSLNEKLSAAGYRVDERGKVGRLAARAETIDQMNAHAGMLTELRRRNCHARVLASCTTEVLQRSNFHAAQEAVKGLFDRLRHETGSTQDGARLVDELFGMSQGVPVLAMSALQTETERSEQTGMGSLLKGLYGLYRNPLAHDTRARRDAERPVTEQELLDLLTTVSLLHGHLDRCQQTRLL